MAQAFRPSTIYLLRKLQRHKEAARIIGMFPEARVQIVDRQRDVVLPQHPSRPAIIAGKRVLMIGEASSFLRHFDGCLGSSVRCALYVRLVPISNGCPYYCTYCYLAYVYRDHLPFIKLNINYGKMCDEIRDLTACAQNAISFNMGEMLDSLALDHVSLLASRLVPLFSRLSNRYPPEQRIEFYRLLTDAILAHNKHISISLCRETPYVWDHLKSRCDPRKCNCLIW